MRIIAPIWLIALCAAAPFAFYTDVHYIEFPRSEYIEFPRSEWVWGWEALGGLDISVPGPSVGGCIGFGLWASPRGCIGFQRPGAVVLAILALV